MITDATYAQLADAAYQNTGAPVGWIRLPISSPDNQVGYDGAAFGRTDATGKVVEIVIASRGTEFFSFEGDVTACVQMGVNQLPDQYQFAKKFVDEIVKSPSYAGASITLTGHSLGGALTQLLAAETGLTATTFNAYGAMDLIPALNDRYGLNLDPNVAYDNITNHRSLLDPVSILPGSNQLGAMHTHVVPSEIPVWVAAVAAGGVPFAAAGGGYWSHRIGIFGEIFSDPTKVIYDNGVTYTLNTQTGNQQWSVSTETGNVVITQFHSGQVTSVQYSVDQTTGKSVLDANAANIQQYLQQRMFSMPYSGLSGEEQFAWQNGYRALSNALASDPNATVTVDPDGTINISANNSTYGLTEGAAYRYTVNANGQPVGISILSGPGAGQTFTYSTDANLVVTDSQATAITQQMLQNIFNTGSPTDGTGNLIPDGFDGILHATVIPTGGITPIAEITIQVVSTGGTPSGIITTRYDNAAGTYTHTVDTTIRGQAVNVTYTYGTDGQLVAHVNSINGERPYDQADADKAFNKVNPSQLADGDAGVAGTDVGAAVIANDKTNPTGLQTLNNGLPRVIDVLSFINAVMNGDPIPTFSSGLNMLSAFDPENKNLQGAAGVVNGLLSLERLDEALKTGDTSTAILSAAQATTYISGAIYEFTGNTTAGAVNSFMGKALPYLNLIYNLDKGNKDAAAIALVDIIGTTYLGWSVPYVGWAVAIVTLVDAITTEAPAEIWGSAHPEWSGKDTIAVGVGISTLYPPEPTVEIVTNSDGTVTKIVHPPLPVPDPGLDIAVQTYNGMLSSLGAMIDLLELENPDFPLGIVANRMPSLTYRAYSGFQLTDIDPLTGVQVHPEIYYDMTGKPYDAPLGSELGMWSFGERFIRSALARGAIAPMWEVDTAALQTQAGDPMAGLTEEERAARADKLAAPIASGDITQIFRPVALDLNGDGTIQTTGTTRTVSWNVDDYGYLKDTPWLDSLVGTGQTPDAFLFLDRNLNGFVDGGSELFSNSTVALSERGLQGLRWVDSNCDGKITEADPVWKELKVWQDIGGDAQEFNDVNHDGQIDLGEGSELRTLAELGITELNYDMGTFTQDGQLKLLASPELTADAQGTSTTVVPEGILVQTSQGEISLVVTQVDDKSVLEANRDGLATYEDVVETLIPVDTLLANDSLGGISAVNPAAGEWLRITDAFEFTHGTGYLVNDVIHYTPDANYNGDAQFSYTLTASTGQFTTATVDLTVLPTNDRPVVTGIDPLLTPIYGYDSEFIRAGRDGDPDVYGKGAPHYEPYTGFDHVTGTTGLHDTPMEWVDLDPNAGRLLVTDPDGDTAFTYEVSIQSQGGKGIVDANGYFSYENWTAPDVPGIQPDIEYESDNRSTTWSSSETPDPFTIKITDEGGASTTELVNATHLGSYSPAVGGGGKKPISIDLGNDGFGFTNVDDSNIFFDINSDGFKHRTSWINAGDGWLAYDVNGNGRVDNGGEISFLQYLDGAQTDLQGLAGFDSNQDGIFSVLDAEWSKFGVWQDANQDGVTDPGELRTLDAMGIASVGLTSDGQFSVIDGQTVHGIGQVTMADGSTLNMADVTVAYSNEVLLANPDGSTSVVVKPPFAPSGEVITGTADQDMLLGNNGNTAINALAGDDVVLSGIGNDVIDGGAGNDLIYAAEGNDLVNGDVGDDVIFAGLGSDIVGGGDGHDAILAEGGNDIVLSGNGNDFVSGGDGNDVVTAGDGDDQVFGEYGNDALYGEEGNDQLAGMDGYDRLNGGVGEDLLDGGNQDDELFGGEGNDTLIGGAGIDTMSGGTGNDIYVVDNLADIVSEVADAGIDTVQSSVNYTLADNVEHFILTGTMDIDAAGNALDNTLTGNDGANVLDGGAGADTLIGGQGNDTLMGGAGNDRYVISLGEGSDRIVDALGNDTIYIGGNLTETDLEGERVGNNLVVKVLGTVDSITLTDWFLQGEGVNRIEFGDGSFLDHAGIEGLMNRPPVANPDAITVYEDGGVVNLPSATLVANDTDPNADDIISVVSVGSSAVGAIVALANGEVKYDIGNRFQELGAGQTVADTFGYTISDSKGATASSMVNVTITGVNDAPVTTADDATALQEDATLAAVGNVLSNDTDIDQGTMLIVADAGQRQGNYGQLTLNADGSYTYALDNALLAVQSLADGQVVTETFTYQATDGLIATPSVLTITITGTNDVPVTSVDVAAVQEDLNTAATGNVLGNDTDVDQGAVLTVMNSGVFAGSYGQLTLATDGSYSYALDNASLAVQSLAAGQTITDTFAYQATDGMDATPSILTVTITGTNDAPVTTVDTATVQEDLSIAAIGNVLSNDTDVDQGAVLSIADAGLRQGNFGQLTLNADGSYAYNVDNNSIAVQSLGRNAQVSENFAYTVTDGMVGVSSALDVCLNGTNDAPILVAPLADQDFTFNKPFSWQMPSGSFADIDQGDTLDFTATLADGSPLPDWLSFDAATQTFSGVAPKIVGYVDIRLTATDRVAATGDTVDSLSASDVFRLSISHGNQGVGNGQDAAPAGLAINFNDGSGTAPGNPGAQGGGSIVLQGTQGNDVLTDTSGNNLLDGGMGADLLTGNIGNELFIGGAGNDTITTSTGADIIAFNRGDGIDTVVSSTGADNTLSLGGIDYQSLSMSKSGSDLILNTGPAGSGQADQIILQNWYSSAGNQSIANLQLVLDAVAFSAVSSDPLLNRQVQSFDFALLAQNFDQALASNPALTSWTLTDTLLDAHLTGSDAAALGGDLAYQYNLNGTLAGIGLASAQTVINDTNFGVAPQLLRPLADLQTGSARLG